MSKRDRMLQQLKRANKRRSRKPVAVSTANGNSSVRSDLLGRIGECILDFSDLNFALTDKQIIECLTKTIHDQKCNDATATDLQTRLMTLKPVDDDSNTWTSALKTFLNDVQQVERGSEDPRSFISYLHVIAS